MIYQHSVTSFLAANFCIFLGAFALTQGRTKTNLLFAIYNFCNAAWNLGDFLYIFDLGSGEYEWILRITGSLACFLICAFLHFAYEFSNITHIKPYKYILIIFYGLAIFFSIAHQTPLLHVTHLNNYSDVYGYWSQPGPLFPFYGFSLAMEVIVVIVSLYIIRPKLSGLKKTQVNYLIFASVLGLSAVIVFYLSFVLIDLPWLYYSLQATVGFIFTYSIFKHNLIKLHTGLKRSALAIGLYVFVGFLTAPFALIIYQQFFSPTTVPISTFFSFLLLFGFLISIANLSYGYIVRRSSIFQEESAWHLTHEFKSPLAIIENAREMIEDEMAKPTINHNRIRRYTEIINNNTYRLNNFVQDILNLGKADNVPDDKEKSTIRLAEFIISIVDQIPEYHEKIIVKNLPPCTIRFYEEGLRQVIMNLLTNAFKYSPHEPIEINTEISGSSVCVSISDQGMGINKKELDHLFKPFFQGVGKEGNIKGSGLGLAIAKKWVEAHGGKIWAESQGPGHGSKFSFTVPVIKQEDL